MRKVSPWALVGVMAVVVVVLAAVLVVRDDGPGARDRLDAVGPAVAAAGTAHLTMTVDLGVEDLDLAVEGTGAVDFGSGAGWITIELAGERLEMRSDGDRVFVLPAGHQQWMTLPAEDLGAQAVAAGPAEVAALVDALAGPLEDVDDLGEEEVGGVPVRHLRVELDPDAAPEAVAALAPGDAPLTLHVWIDGQDLPVRQRLEGQVEGVDLALTVDLDRWGEPLGVEIPPPGEIRDVAPEELEQLFGSAPG